MDKALRNTLIIGIMLISLSVGYYMIYRPIQKQSQMKKCSNDTEGLIKWNSSSPSIMNKFEAEYGRCLRERGL